MKKITQLKQANEMLNHLQKVILELSKSDIEDLSQISSIYIEFLRLFDERVNKRNINKSEKMQMFILLVVMIYSKETFFGKKLKKGIRNKLANILSIAPTQISYNLQVVLFLYSNYDNLRKDVDYFYGEILKRIEKNNENS